MSSNIIYLSTFKQSLKELAKEIREKKAEIKQQQREGKPSFLAQWKLPDMQREYRHKHIAYCLFRGRTLEQIEPKSYSKPDMSLVNIWKSCIQRDPIPQKLYVIVSSSLSKSQQAVQAGHALAEFLKLNPNSGWKNGTLVYLKTSQKELQELLEATGATPFHEEDLGGKLTAIAALGIARETAHLPLM